MAGSPAANPRGEVDFTDSAEGKTYHIDREGKVTPAAERSPGGIAQAFGPDGGLYSLGAQGLVGPAAVIDPQARAGDLVVGHDGSIYITQPAADDQTRQVRYGAVSPQGVKRVVDVAIQASDRHRAVSIIRCYLVADGQSHWVHSFQIAADGSP